MKIRGTIVRTTRRAGALWLRDAVLAGALATLTGTLPVAASAQLRIAIQDESAAEGEPIPPPTRFAPLKRVIEMATGKTVDVFITRDRTRILDLMERNGADFFFLHGTDLAGRALNALGYHFIGSARPDVRALYIGSGPPVENLRSFVGKSVAMPAPDSLYGQMCAAEWRDFGGSASALRPSRETSAVVWTVENAVAPVGCIPSNARALATLEAKRLRVVYEGRPVPNMPVVAGLGVSAGDRAAVARALSGLEEDHAAFKVLGVSSFSTAGEARVRSLAQWLKGK